MVTLPAPHTTKTKTNWTTNTLYGEDADAKAKAKASRGSSKLGSSQGMETVVAGSTHSAISTLYGSDADTKPRAKAFRGQRDLEVVLSDDNIITDALVQDLLDAIQEKLLPSLAVCNSFLDDPLGAWRFVIYDAFVKCDQPEEECQNDVLVPDIRGSGSFLEIHHEIT